jgi:predicted metalloenzyme YecM
MEMKKCWYQQFEFRELMFKQLKLHKNDINALARTLEDLSHATKHLKKCIDMVQVQCDQIGKAQALILSQKDFSKYISTNIVTRRGTETQELPGPVWYQEEQARKAKQIERMT